MIRYGIKKCGVKSGVVDIQTSWFNSATGVAYLILTDGRARHNTSDRSDRYGMKINVKQTMKLCYSAKGVPQRSI